MRFAYKRICEEKTRSEIEASLKACFPQLNSNYRRSGYFRAIDAYKAAIFRVKLGLLETPSKVVFGGRKNLIRYEKGQLSKFEWRAIRNNQLYSRGEKAKNGNLNLRFELQEGKLQLRVNNGFRSWIRIPAYLPHSLGVLSGDRAYGVRILRRGKNYELRVNYEETNYECVGFEKGAIGVDFNHSTIDLSVTNSQGQLKATRTILCSALTSARKGKKEWLIGNLAKEVVRFAKYWRRGLVLERLKDVARGRSNQHKFAHQKFLTAVQRRAYRDKLQIRFVNPAYTSVIGKWKYTPFYHITVHQAAALVVARRGQGFHEHLRGLKTLVLKPMEGRKNNEQKHNRRVHAWSLWRRLRNLPSRKGTDNIDSGQSPETIGVENQRKKYPRIRLGEDEASDGKIVILGSGPSSSDGVKEPHK